MTESSGTRRLQSALEASRPYARGGRTGPLISPIGGRTDKIPANVPAGAYVLPADHVSALGQGNTLNGMKVLEGMFNSGPYGMKLQKPRGGSTMPRAPREPRAPRADGGAVGDIPIMAAGGEYVISPEQVAEIGGGDINIGHDILDQWVLDTRKEHVDTLKKLPGPAK